MPTEDAYLSRIQSRQGARSAYLVKAKQGAEAIGRDVLALKDMGMTVSEIARRVNIPRPTLNEFVTIAEKTEPHVTTSAPLTPLPVFAGAELVDAVEGDPIIEIAASFDDSDTMFLSGEPFARFVNPDWAAGMRIPHLMLRLEADGWVGVDNVSVGYGGTGPGNAHEALLSVGIDDDLAHDIAYCHRVSHVRFDHNGNPKWLHHGRQWPRIGLGTPRPFGDNSDRFRVKVRITGDACSGETDSDQPPRDTTQNGFYPSAPDSLTLSQRWLRYLDSPPAWLASPADRRGTLFTSPEAARAAGFAGRSHAYQLIIEQGPVQLWFTAYTSSDPSVWVATEFHNVLLDAGLLPKEVIDSDEASTLRKLVSRHRNRRPASISLGDGDVTRP